jgi:flavin-dependent dehydrogenase
MGRRSAHRGQEIWDVIVVGAGPAGSTCAASLARSGYRVLLLEQQHSPGAAANCTGILGIEAFDVFDLPNDLTVNSIDRIKFVGPLRREVDFTVGRDLARVVRRRELDAALARRAVESGAELRTGIRVLGGSRGPDGVEVQGTEIAEVEATDGTPGGSCEPAVERPEGEPGQAREADAGNGAGRSFSCRGRVLVLAVGYNLAILSAFGLRGPAQFVQGAQLLCRHRGVEEVHVFVGSNYAPGSFGWAVPLEPGWVKVGLTTARQARLYLEALVETPQLRDLLDLTDARLRMSPIPVGAMERCYGDRLLVVGEAAGQVKTTSNGGIYYSMLGARVAAQTLDDCLQSDSLEAPALKAYDRAWREILADELAMGRRLRSTFESMSDTKLAALMWIASVDGLLNLIRDRADFDWHRPLVEDLLRHRLVGPFLEGPANP